MSNIQTQVAAMLIFIALMVFKATSVTAAEFSAAPFGGIQSQVEILPVDEAFALQVLRQTDKIEVLWQIRPGHYLYRHSLGLVGSERLGSPEIPKGLDKQDEYFGDVEVYYDALIIEAPIASELPEEITVQYQGCSDAGICYPPQKRKIEL